MRMVPIRNYCHFEQASQRDLESRAYRRLNAFGPLVERATQLSFCQRANGYGSFHFEQIGANRG